MISNDKNREKLAIYIPYSLKIANKLAGDNLMSEALLLKDCHGNCFEIFASDIASDPDILTELSKEGIGLIKFLSHIGDKSNKDKLNFPMVSCP